MTDRDVIRLLRCPAADIVDLAVSRANLTEHELQTIALIGRKGLTQEAAAEQLCYSVDAVHKWYRSAMSKLRDCWSGLWWVRKILE